MNYEKLTPDLFAERLKNGHYKNLTGARRAIGKASVTASWSKTATDKANQLADANKNWASPKPKVAKSAKKVIQQKARAAAKPAKRSAKRAAAPVPDKEKKAEPDTVFVPTSLVHLGRGGFYGEDALRLASSSVIIETLGNRTDLNDQEQATYTTHLAEARRLAHPSSSDPGRKAPDARPGRKREPRTSVPVHESDADASPGIKADETVGAGRIQIPNGDHLTGEARAQHEKMKAAAQSTGVQPT